MCTFRSRFQLRSPPPPARCTHPYTPLLLLLVCLFLCHSSWLFLRSSRASPWSPRAPGPVRRLLRAPSPAKPPLPRVAVLPLRLRRRHRPTHRRLVLWRPRPPSTSNASVRRRPGSARRPRAPARPGRNGRWARPGRPFTRRMPRPSTPLNSRLSPALPPRHQPRVPLRRWPGASARVLPLPLSLRRFGGRRARTRARQRRPPASVRRDGRRPRSAAVLRPVRLLRRPRRPRTSGLRRQAVHLIARCSWGVLLLHLGVSLRSLLVLGMVE